MARANTANTANTRRRQKPRCLNPYQIYPELAAGCTGRATTSRETWRVGHHFRGEPSVVMMTVPLCGYCARLWDQTTRPASRRRSCPRSP